jgi:hypothetical protein|tara:strand:- start:7385 stop:7822 length:438 start_codon:yes stop_codon:yes gene_type:complete
MVIRLFLFILLFYSCSSDYSDIKKINRESLFHGNSSKIWVINKVKKKGVNYAALKLKDKDVAIFYESKKILIQPMKTLGTFPSKTGTLELSDDNKRCEFHFPNEVWRFTTVEISSKKISLKPMKNSAFFYEMELIPYPESEAIKN